MGGLIPPRALTADDDREAFDCGRESLNTWLRRHAWRNQRGGISRTTIIRDPASDAVAAYTSLSAGQIERAFLAKPVQRNQPEVLPVILLGQLAVDHRYQRRGYGRSLLAFALMTSLRVSKEIGCVGVLTHPVDNDARLFYRQFDFEDVPGDPRGSMMVRIAELERRGT
jgi:GNAT superfamily N-acetyltransferase